VVEAAADRVGPRRSVAGTSWQFPGSARLEVTGPTGPVVFREGAAGDERTAQRVVVADQAGRYSIKVGDRTEMRIATLEEREITRPTGTPDGTVAEPAQSGQASRLDVSAELGVAVLLLFAAELLFRWFTAVRRRGAAAPPA
jgi:hypothetical protein